MGSTTRRSSFALGRGRLDDFVAQKGVRQVAKQGLTMRLVRFSLRRPFRDAFSYSSFRLVSTELFKPGRRPVFELHAKGQAARSKHFLDFVERLATQIRRLQQLGSVRWIRSPM